MKSIKRVLVFLVICLTLVGNVFAACNGITYEQCSVKPTDETQAEQVVWYYRDNNGVKEMRLWSITRGIWLTDWIPAP